MKKKKKNNKEGNKKKINDDKMISPMEVFMNNLTNVREPKIEENENDK